LLWSRAQPKEPKLGHVKHLGDTFLTREHTRTWESLWWVCSDGRDSRIIV